MMAKGKSKALIDQGARPVVPADHDIGTIKLGTLVSFRQELQRIYKAVTHGQITPEQGAKLSWMVNQMRIAKRDEVALEIAEKGGIAGVPFAGVVFVAPDDDASNSQ